MGDVEATVPTVRCGARLALVDEDARLDPRSSYAASKVAQEHHTVGVGAPGRRRGAALPQRLRPRMPRDTPVPGVAAMFRSSSSGGERPQVSRTAARCATSSNVDDVARATVLALRGGRRSDRAA